MPETEGVSVLQPAEPKPTNWPRIILAALLGLGLLGGVAYAGYWYGAYQISSRFSPTDCTASWTIYTDEDQGYSLKYPESDYSFSFYARDGITLQHCPGEKERYGDCGYQGNNIINIYFYNLDPSSEEDYNRQLKTYVEPPECVWEDPRTYQHEWSFRGHDWFVYEYFLDALSKKVFCPEEFYAGGYQKRMVTEHDGKAMVVSISNASCSVIANLWDVITTLEFLD